VDFDHWLIPNKERWGRFVPDWIKNQPWNLNPQSSGFNRLDKYAMNPLKRAWLETPDWFKAGLGGLMAFDVSAISSEFINELERRCECERIKSGRQ
jgi:hypothetical protein